MFVGFPLYFSGNLGLNLPLYDMPYYHYKYTIYL
jgi:hypothetical protein